jgi:hypothetical protein
VRHGSSRQWSHSSAGRRGVREGGVSRSHRKDEDKNVSHAEMLKGWFVMVKDSKGRYARNKLWGDGWGWSWFDAANPSKTTSADYKTDCQPCHVPARASDWIYVSGYPPLRG